MLEIYQAATISQYESALRTLTLCINSCDDATWDGDVAQCPYSQSLFHALFFADLYLERSPESFRQQAYHRQHIELFGDYEQLENRVAVQTYSRAALHDYIIFCRDKARTVVAAETAVTLAERTGFSWLDFPRAELHVYNIRHLIHHAAQLSMRLRLNATQQTDSNAGVDWVKAGWE